MQSNCVVLSQVERSRQDRPSEEEQQVDNSCISKLPIMACYY